MNKPNVQWLVGASRILVLVPLAATPLIAQSPSAKKDIPAIAKAANGAVASIIMSDKDGKPISQGSGFLVSEEGFIVTNYHVISEGSSALVKFPNGAFFLIDGVISLDKVRDVAVIKAHGSDFRTLTLGNSDRIQVGEEVVAIGNPLSLESTVSNGIISGIRTAESLGGKFLQITTPISPGSSGGPLFNMAGEVVGITTMRLEGGENLNFAIPINDVKPLLTRKVSKLQDLPNEPQKGGGDTSLPSFASKTPATTWTGQFGGIVHNKTAGISASFGIIVDEVNGSIGGCMVVQQPLFGSGPLTGRVEGSNVSFVVPSAIGTITFFGQRRDMDISGTYTVKSQARSDQKGNFTLHQDSTRGLPAGFSTANCPTDAEVHR